MKTRLFIEENEIELTEDVSFALNKQFESLENPTIIINDWSKSIHIPFSNKNNKIFNNLFNPDRINGDGEGMIVHFDPLKKLDFRLEWNDSVIMTGYAKMNSVTREGAYGYYDITLNGQLGKLFQEMKKITFDPEQADEPIYLIKGSEYVDFFLTKDKMKEFWESAGQVNNRIEDSTLTDIIGFAPNNSYSDNFDYKTFQLNYTSSEKFDKILGDNFKAETGVEASSIIGDGLLPRDIGEYRSYNQLPYIYFNKLFQIFQKKSEEITGYKFYLDPDWFNTTNPYWYKLVFMLNKLNSSKKPSQVDNRYTVKTQYNYFGDWKLNTTYTNESKYYIGVKTIDYENEPILGTSTSEPLSDQYFIILNDDRKSETFHINFPLYLQSLAASASDNNKIKENNALIVEVCMDTGTANGTYGITPINTYTNKYMIVDNNTTLNQSTYSDYTFIKIDSASYGDEKKIINLDSYFSVFNNKDGDRAKIYVKTKWLLNEFPLQNTSAKGEVILWCSNENVLVTKINTDDLKSNSKITLNLLWDHTHNLFDEILKYCKMYRILIFNDEFNKTIKFIPSYKYFSDYKIEDWTGKLDMSNDYVVEPITWDSKYVILNYDDSKTMLGENYRQKYSLNYGDFKIITNYNFNTEVKKIFTGLNAPIVNTDNVLSWSNLYNNKIIYSLPNEFSIYCKDKENKYVSCFGQYYFFNGLKSWDKSESLNLRNVIISDDTPLQQSTNTYFYSQDVNGVIVNTYPYLDTYYNDGGDIRYTTTFSVPMEDYTYENRGEAKGIYDTIWNKYIRERYNPQNKKVTCYLKLSPIDILNFRFNKFIIIENQLYFVNKIYDFDPSETNLSTKVDLLTISNIEAYTSIDYDSSSPKEIVVEDYITPRISGNIETANFYLTYVQSYYDLNFINGNKQTVVGGVELTIVPTHKVIGGVEYNYVINYRKVERYNRDNDTVYATTITNGYNNQRLEFIRYRDYPNPPVMTKSKDKIPQGFGVITLQVETQFPPLSISYGHISGLTLSQFGEWEYHNDDYVYYSLDVRYQNNYIGSSETSTYITVTTGSGYQITQSIGVKNKSISI